MKGNFYPKINTDKETIYKRMKVSENSKMRNVIDKKFNSYLEIAISKIDFQTVFLIKDNSFKFDIAEVDSCEKVIFCFGTIGCEISDLISELFAKGDYLEGYLLNEISNDIIMKATNQMYEYVKSEMKKQDYNLTKRFSPDGYSFEMKHQVTIMEQLKQEFDIKASLTESFMINPEKSELFLYGADKNIPEINLDCDCSTCESMECPYKKKSIK